MPLENEIIITVLIMSSLILMKQKDFDEATNCVLFFSSVALRDVTEKGDSLISIYSRESSI